MRQPNSTCHCHRRTRPAVPRNKKKRKKAKGTCRPPPALPSIFASSRSSPLQRCGVLFLSRTSTSLGLHAAPLFHPSSYGKMATSMTYIYSPEQHSGLLPWIAALHASCITMDHMVGPFLPPLTNEKLLPWWRERIAEAVKGTRVIVLLLPETTPGRKPAGTDLRGVAMLKLSESETGSFRGQIDAVLVNQKYRRQGGAKQLVEALEYEAAKRGRNLLVWMSRKLTPLLLQGSGRPPYDWSFSADLIQNPNSSSTLRPIASPRRLSRSSDTSRSGEYRNLVAFSPTPKRAEPFSTKTFSTRYFLQSRAAGRVL